MRVSVPGNILLLGEYAVLEEGGLGLALAIDRRVRISVDPWNRLLIEGSWIGGAMRWTPEDPSASPLLSAAVEELSLWQRHAGGTKPVLGGRVSIDSSEFYQPDGRKAGFGSSAAVVVGLVCALLASAGHAYAISEGTALRLALSAHRRAQGGRGSGYDVYCSFHGGHGLFHGGKAPAWETCRLQWGHSLVIFPGPSPVSTPDAILEYRSWKENNPDKARSLLEESNRRVLSFVRSRSERERLPVGFAPAKISASPSETQ